MHHLFVLALCISTLNIKALHGFLYAYIADLILSFDSAKGTSERARTPLSFVHPFSTVLHGWVAEICSSHSILISDLL